MRARSLLFGIALCCCAGAVGEDRDKAVPGPALKRLDAKQAADLEDKFQKLYARLAPSVVRIFLPKREGGFSGVIVSSSGEVLTCAHHDLPPKTEVMVELADGRKVTATVLGSVKQKAGARSSHHAADFGLVLLDEKKRWPAAKLGRSAGAKPGDLCLALGYPNVHKPGQPPLLRLGRNLSPHAVGLLRTTCRIHPGDSGGPLFDLDGRVVGAHTAMESLKTGINWHSPVERFLDVRDRLRAGEQVKLVKDQSARHEPRSERGGAWEAAAELRKSWTAARDSTAEILDEGKVIALGLVVAKDGWVLTKRTPLTGPRGPRRLVCRLTDGRQFTARVRGESWPHDLALLKVHARGLPAARWGKSAKLGVGQLVASLGLGGEPLNYAVVGALRAKSPGTQGRLPILVKPAPRGSAGVMFAGFLPKRLEIEEARDLLEVGDIITHLDGVPTPTHHEFVKAGDRRALAGEWAELTAVRKGKVRKVFLPLIAGPAPLPFPWRDARWSLRKDGFPNIFVHDGGVAHDRCGGPVVDRSGQVVGINIARADPIQTFAIPSDVVQEVIAELKAQAQKKGGPRAWVGLAP
jgi:serine protease Do